MTTSSIRFAPNPLSMQRIGAWSAALLLHLLAFAALILPMPTPLPTPVAATPEALITEFIARIVPPTTPVPPMPAPPIRPTTRTLAPRTPSVVTPIDDAALTVPVAVPLPDAIPEFSAEPVAAAASDAVIAYLDAPPPPYPIPAIRRGLEGTVHLRVRVDADGRPLEVLVDRSSGHAVLDRQASAHVLRRWRFQPATVDGRPAIAWARVPIGFRLDRA